ncbi:hypothetical protein [Aliikangiella coralliicola]|uniref:Uncharacterized protein n=1 Tax=Aliikangiella coralliicola TaxID=2592383 RepID=A0A545UFV3_9GAMM|nr:hypothetical protein [Aliikangiella coralliicola]TQV88351.1 hypothetical protein FLL46_07445 [Aliikangiella coralliicola]
MSNIKELRLKLAKLARSKRTRHAGFSRELPSDWSPQKIINPKTGFAFSDESAWHLIADLLEDQSIEVKIITMRKPPGQEAIEILYDYEPNASFLYIKVHLGFGNKKVLGRSFHPSTKGRMK